MFVNLPVIGLQANNKWCWLVGELVLRKHFQQDVPGLSRAAYSHSTAHTQNPLKSPDLWGLAPGRTSHELCNHLGRDAP